MRPSAPDYVERNWPPALKDARARPLASLRQSFLNGSLTRLVDPDAILRAKVVEFIMRGDFGLASGKKPDGTYERMWYPEPLPEDRQARRADRILARLAWKIGILSPPGCRPKGMYWRTFHRLRARHDALVSASLAGMACRFGVDVEG